MNRTQGISLSSFDIHSVGACLIQGTELSLSSSIFRNCRVILRKPVEPMLRFSLSAGNWLQMSVVERQRDNGCERPPQNFTRLEVAFVASLSGADPV
jgi:hypothetical protein